MTRVLLDTGPLVALLNRRDAHHAWAVEVASHLSEPLWTCEPVLAEAAYLTGAPEAILARVASGVLRIGLELEEHAGPLGRLVLRYGPRMDLADACVVRLSEVFRDSKVFTTDRTDFSIYRRNGREVIPLIAPD